MSEYCSKTAAGPNDLTEETLANLDENELLLLFHHKSWKHMDETDRLRALQEVENRRAWADGRPAAQVCPCSTMEPNQLGQFIINPDDSTAILINSRYLEPSRLFGKSSTSVFNAAGALGTVLHEGRHAYQAYLIENDLGIVSDEQQLEWAVVFPTFGGLYCGDDPIIYYLQSIEMDARRFARRTLTQLNSLLNDCGNPDRSFEYQAARYLQLEERLITLVREQLDHESIDQHEKKVLEHFRQYHPEIDLTDLRPFDHARFILDHPEITDPLQMLEALDRMADEKLYLNADGNMNRIQDIDEDSFEQIKG